MLAFSTWQPHATLLILGIKPHETRHWAPPPAIQHRVLGKRVAIHAARNTVELRALAAHIAARKARRGCDPLWIPFADALSRHIDDVMNLPLGALLGTAVFRAIHRCTGNEDFGPFGDFSPGRYAWTMSDPKPFETPIPYIGRQGFFEVPDSLLPIGP